MKKMARAFSLVEILVVLALVILLAGISIPKFFQIQKISKLKYSSEIIFDQLRLSKIEARSLNKTVALLLIDPHLSDNTIYTQVGRFIQINPAKEKLETFQLQERKINLPQGVVIHNHPRWSNLLSEASSSGTFKGVKGNFRAILFYPNGKTNLDAYDSEGIGNPYYFTVTFSEELTLSEPKNFIMISLDPQTGMAKIWQKR